MKLKQTSLTQGIKYGVIVLCHINSKSLLKASTLLKIKIRKNICTTTNQIANLQQQCFLYQQQFSDNLSYKNLFVENIIQLELFITRNLFIELTPRRSGGAVQVEGQVTLLLSLAVVVEHHPVGAQLLDDLTRPANISQWFSRRTLQRKPL